MSSPCRLQQRYTGSDKLTAAFPRHFAMRNAVHATGKRIRKLPIGIENLLDA
jgi:hypothetical protein